MIHRLDVADADRAQRLGSEVPSAAAPAQLTWTAVGVVLFIAVLLLVRDHRILQRFTYTAMLAGLGLLLLPLLPFIGTTINGARIWIRLAGFSFQPGELAKLVLLVFFAGYLVVKRDVLALAGRRVLGIDLPRARDLGPILVAWGASLAVLIFERDLGTSLLFFGMFVALLYVATERRSWLLIGLGLFMTGSFLAWTLFGHVQQRVDIWLHAFADRNVSDDSYQLVQGLYGMGSGGILGKGLGQGRPDIVPFAKTDFIVAAIGEELGLTGLMALLLLYAVIVQRGLRTAVAVRDSFGKLLSAGLAFSVALQVFVVVGGVTRLIPLTGLTAPFLSYGGSSLVANWALIAMLLRISDASRRPAPPPVTSLENAKTQVVRAQDLHNDPNNPRLILEEYSRERGPILVDGKPIARSVETDDRLKYQRKYTRGRLYAPAVGFYSIVYGASGIEAEANSILAGTDDSLFVRRVIDQITGEQVKGGSVELTLNPRAQRAAYRGLAGRKGAVVALEPATGAILAMATSPSYDPNTLSSHDTAAVRAAFDKLNSDPAKPALNRALRQIYPPGSTFKLVTAAAALESGKFSRNSQVYNGAQLDLPLTTVNLPNFDGQACNPAGRATLEDALKRSCNAAFGKVGLAVGADALRQQAERFGFDRAIDIPMPSAASRFPTDPNAPQTAQSAIGQFDVRATPLQMAMVAAAIGNRGVLMNPFLVQEVRGPDLAVLNHTNPDEIGEAISPRTADTLAEMMVTVVEQGTGSNARIDGVRVGGKTGTAQQGGDRRPHAWFVSLAPIDDPKVAVAVVIEDGGGAAEISGNELAAPIAREVMKAVLGR